MGRENGKDEEVEDPEVDDFEDSIDDWDDETEAPTVSGIDPREFEDLFKSYVEATVDLYFIPNPLFTYLKSKR